MRLLIYLLFIAGFAALGYWAIPLLGILGAAAGWALAITALWFYDYGTDRGHSWCPNMLVGDSGDSSGGIFDFDGFDGGSCADSGGGCDGGGGGD